MKKFNIFIGIFFLIFNSFNGFSQNNDSLKNNIEPFSEVRIFGCLAVELIQGEKETVEIETRSKRIDKEDIRINVSGKTLKVTLRYEGGLFSEKNCDGAKATVKIYYKTMKEIQTGGGAEVKFASIVKADDFVAEAHTGSTLKMEVEVGQIWLDSKTGASLQISGKADIQETVVTTGGTLRAYDLISNKVYIRANTGGDAKITATSFIEASAGTGGYISFKGNPKGQDIRTSLGGDVSQTQ